MATAPIPRLTPAQYLERERRAAFKSEFFDGEMFAMAGATEAHNLIVANAISRLHRQLEGRPCKVYPSDMRVKIAASGLYTYPDVVVVCGEPQFEDERRDTLLNPTALFEVLSDSTEAYDRGKKFEHYRKLESLREYVLISQDRCLIERFTRHQGNDWVLTEASDPQQRLDLASIQCHLLVSEVYDKIEL